MSEHDELVARLARIEAKLDALTIRPAGEWMTRSEYAELVGLSLKTLYNSPWRLPPTEEGPTRARCIRRALAEEWAALPESEQRRRYGANLLRMVK